MHRAHEPCHWFGLCHVCMINLSIKSLSLRSPNCNSYKELPNKAPHSVFLGSSPRVGVSFACSFLGDVCFLFVHWCVHILNCHSYEATDLKTSVSDFRGLLIVWHLRTWVKHIWAEKGLVTLKHRHHQHSTQVVITHNFYRRIWLQGVTQTTLPWQDGSLSTCSLSTCQNVPGLETQRLPKS